MNSLIIRKTKNTPLVNFDGETGVCEISGDAFPNNSAKFWHPVFRWLSEYTNEGNKEITFKFKLSNLNLGTTKALFSILDKLENYRQEGIKTKAFWFFNENDMHFREIWKDLTEDTNIPNFLVNCENLIEEEYKSGTKIGKSLGSINRFTA